MVDSQIETRVLMSGLLSKSTAFHLVVFGPVSSKEMERLIQKLSVDKDILAEDEKITPLPDASSDLILPAIEDQP